MLLDVRDRPSLGKWFILSFQHVFAMFSATILIPLLVGLPITVALFASGAGTLIYILCTKAKIPVYLGSSGAYVGVIAAVSGFADTGQGHYATALTGLFVVGIIYCILAIIVKFTGTEWMNKLLPPVVVGPMIMVIGLGLAGYATVPAGLTGDGSWKEILTALVSLAIVVTVALKGKGFIKVIPFLIGIIGGFIFASIIGLVDFTNFIIVVKDPNLWFKIPEFMFLGFKDGSANVLGTEITFYQMNFAAVLTIAPLALVTAAEHIGDHTVLSKIVGKEFLQDPGLHRTLAGDGIATSFAALIGGPANTTYGENTSVVGMTKVASVWVTGGAAIIAIFLSFFNVFTVLISSIPGPVMGGISIVLYGFIAANGLKVLHDTKTSMEDPRNLIITSVMLIVGLGGSIINFGGSFSLYGVSLAALLGIVLNLILPKTK